MPRIFLALFTLIGCASAFVAPFRGQHAILRRLPKSASTSSDDDSDVSGLIRRPPSVINGEIITGDSSDEEQSKRVFEKLVDYPCNFQVKVIGLKQDRKSVV